MFLSAFDVHVRPPAGISERSNIYVNPLKISLEQHFFISPPLTMDWILMYKLTDNSIMECDAK